MTEITTQSQDCGYTSLLDDALTFPPNSTLPPVPYNSTCAIYSAIINASTALNPCFNRYHITDSCPFPWNPVGGPITGLGPTNYFNRSDVQKAINAYPTDYFVCKNGIFPTTNGLDISPPSSLGPLPRVIERTNNTIIAHGLLDFELLSKGSLISIQNMTWNGKQGFERQPVEPLFVPYGQSGGGVLGTAHTERGLTFSEVFLAGHGMSFLSTPYLLGQYGTNLDRNTRVRPQRGIPTAGVSAGQNCESVGCLDDRSGDQKWMEGGSIIETLQMTVQRIIW